MLQNRVTPAGDIIRSAARGTLMGNRGVIHNDEQQIIRAFRHTAWITCSLQFKDRHRAVMTPGRWTELFFLDEVTAFAAGHRPCAECRREAFNRFKAAWLAGNPGYGFDKSVSIRKIDEILQRERIDGGTNVKFDADVRTLPGGTFVAINDNYYLISDRMLLPWSPSGYQTALEMPASQLVSVLTPRSIVNCFSAGYSPLLHPASTTNQR